MFENLQFELQKEFEQSRKMLRYYVDLKLSLAEQVILKRIVAGTINSLLKDTCRVRYNPATESAVRFLFQEYGVLGADTELYSPLIGGYHSDKAAEILNAIQFEQNLF